MEHFLGWKISLDGTFPWMEHFLGWSIAFPLIFRLMETVRIAAVVTLTLSKHRRRLFLLKE
jgi:hypothetical protein